MKTLKSCNCLHRINSNKEHIFLFFICLSVFLSIFKTYFSMLSKDKYQLTNLFILKLHEIGTFKDKVMPSLSEQSSFYVHLDGLLRSIKSDCQRTQPPQREAILIKKHFRYLMPLSHHTDKTY